MALAPSCLPRIVKVDSSCGCTLTRASIRGMTPGAMESLANTEIDLARIIANSAEAKALGVQERGLSTLLRSAIKDIKPKIAEKKIDEQSVILPYFQRRQRSVINANFFAITAGAVHPTAGAGGVPASAWNITVDLGASPFKSALTNIERYFLPGATLIVLTWESATVKTARTLQFTVHSAANATTNTAVVTVVPNVSATAWSGFNAGQKAVYQPIFGLVQTGTNNVNDRESWCYNQPADLSVKLLVNWVQTSRESRCITDSYKETLDLIMQGKVNEFQRAFNHMPLAEQNKRQAQLSDDAWMRSVWYNQRFNELQEPETYDQLPTVTDPSDPACVLEYKANALGIETILRDCGRAIDWNAAAPDLDYVFAQLSLLKRYRESDGDRVEVIDAMTDRYTASRIRDIMGKYYKAKYGWELTKNAQINQKLTHDNTVLFNYDLYDIPDEGLQLAVFWDPFFDDMLSAFPATAGAATDFKSRGRALWFIDWSDVAIGLGATKSVVRKSPDAATNDLYKCVITPNVTEYNLRSWKWTTMVDRPHRHLVIGNFSDATPVLHTKPGGLGDLVT